MLSRWHDKVFYLLNHRVGKHVLFDRVMYALAQWGIFFLYILFALCFVPQLLHDQASFLAMVEWFSVLLISALAINYMIALLFPVPRPYECRDSVKCLVQPLADWKSFPSDHSMLAALPVFFLSVLFPEFIFLPQFTSIALLIMTARVYAGVHYPRDVVGGIGVAMCSFLFML